MIQLPKDKGREKALRTALSSVRKVSVYGLAGSSTAMMLAETGRNHPMIVIADSLDDAGYLYHDLTRLCGDDAVTFLPSGYKRHIKYGQTDAPSQILRNEATTRLYAQHTTLRFLVTYPEALAEKVASPRDITSHTLHISVGENLNLTETLKWLRENGFTEEDYVYEPGHFAVRGSILDIYAYSNELPFRIDLFGNDVDSIRLFNVETQLSEQKLDAIDVSANVADRSAGGSLLDFIDPATVIAVRDDIQFTAGRVRAVADEKFSSSAVLAEEGDADAMRQIVNVDAFCDKLAGMRTLVYSDSDHPAPDCRASLDYNCSPQGIYHKNFDLIGSEFARLQAEGYTIYILSDSEKQHERLRSIFEERGDKVEFTPVIGTIHAGFVDHNTRTCIFTDHQIFDRFHKYSLKSERARSGKLALSLKELSAIEPGDYIVHSDHGVGRFAGLVRSAGINGKMQEMIKLTYLNGDTIFVSLHSLHKLSKYRGKEGAEPRIN